MAMSASEVQCARAVYERLDDEHGLHLVEEIERLRDALKAIEAGIPGPQTFAFETLNP